MMPEAAVLHATRIVWGADPSVVLWRNNTGALPDTSGRVIHFGLAVGSADLVGIGPGGRFLAIECKAGQRGVVSPAQRTWLALVVARGGFVAVVRSEADAHAALEALHAGAPSWP